MNICLSRRTFFADENNFIYLYMYVILTEDWRLRATAFKQRNIIGTFGRGSVCVRTWFLNDCKIAMHVLGGKWTDVMFRDDVLRHYVIPHFNGCNLTRCWIFMDDNSRSHPAQIVQDCLQNEAVDVFLWSAFTPDVNPIDHVSDQICKIIDEQDPSWQHLAELDQALVHHWQRFTQCKLYRLVQSTKLNVPEMNWNWAGHTNY